MASLSISNWALIALIASFLTFKLVRILTAGVTGTRYKSYNLPPGPSAWPFVGNMFMLIDKDKHPHQILANLAKVYGPVMRLKIGSVNMIYITDSAVVRECTTVQDQLLANRPSMACARYLVGERSMTMSSYGEHYRFARKLFLVELLSSKRIKQFQAVRNEELDLVVREVLAASKRESTVDLHLTFSKLSTNVLTRMCMNKRLYDSGTEHVAREQQSRGALLRSYIESLFEEFALFMYEDFFPGLTWLDKVKGTRGKMQKTAGNLDLIFDELVEDHIKELELRSSKGEIGEGKDFLDVMLLLRAEGGADSKHLDSRNIKAFLLDVIAAGTETSTSQSEWMFTQLLANPEVMAKAQAEVDSVVGKDRCVSETDLQDMPYIDAAVKETLRLHTGPFLLPRSNLIDCKIAGYDIPANSFINIQMNAMHRDDRIWKQPLKFNPDRFLQSNFEYNNPKENSYRYIPFGAGRRMCPGYNLAVQAIKSAVARLIHSFDWSLPDGMLPHELDMSETVHLGIDKRIHLKACPTPRLNANLY